MLFRSGPPGPPGDAGPPPYLATGETTVTDDPDEASLTIRGATPNYRVDAVLPRGPRGLPGDTGPSPYLNIGTVTEGEASASISGATPNYSLNLTIPRGEKGDGAVPVTVATTPEYTTASAHTWEPSLSLYNGESEMMRQVRSLVRRGLQGERLRMVCTGPSTVAGTGGEEPMVAVSSFPGQLTELLGASPGRVSATDFDNRWSYTGAIALRGLHALNMQSTGDFTATYTSREASTGFTLYAYRQSVTDLSISVDGGAPQPVQLVGGSSWKALRIDGLSNQTHQISISGPSGIFIDSIEADSSGLTIHNAGRPSSAASDWIPSGGVSSWSHLFSTAFASEAAASELPRPEVALVQPMLNGSTPADIRTLVQSIVNLGYVAPVLVTSGGAGSMTGGSTHPAQLAAV